MITCPHDDDPNLCPPCVRALVGGPPSWTTVRRLAANYEGRCRACGDPIYVGEVLGVQSDGAGEVRYVCQACA